MFFSVDAHAIGCQLTGNEVYIRNLLHSFAALDQFSEFVAYLAVDDASTWVPERFGKRSIARNPFVRLGFDLSRRLRIDRPDLLHVQYTAPLACPVPVVVSVHDVSFIENPEFFPKARAAQLRWTVARTVRTAAAILTVSEFSRAAIATAFQLDPDRITVAPNAASPCFRPISRPAAADWARSRYGLNAPFILTVGDLQPRKNQIGLVRAFADMVRAHPEVRHHLVLAGKDTWHGSQVRQAAAASGVADRIHFTGFVTDEDLLQLYNACELFVFPSFYEGFGLPVLEAMACGRAVACSNLSAVPEVADAAGILFNPHSTDEIARAMLDLILDSELRGRVERLGLQRATHFSWQEAARRTLEVYYEVADRRRSAVSEKHSAASSTRR